MAYTLATVRNRVLDDRLDDTEFDAGIVDDFINDTQRSIFNTYELPFMEKTFTGTLPSGGYAFTFPTDYQVTQSLKLVDPEDVIRDISDNYMPYKEFNKRYPTPQNRDVGVPEVWTLYQNRLIFSRPTDMDYNLELNYLKTPTTLSDGEEVPEIPESFSELLVLGAYYRILERNEDLDLAAFYKNGDYTDLLDLMVSRLSKRQTNGPTIISQPLRVGHRSRGRR